MNKKKILISALLIFVICAFAPSENKIRIFIIGDSTAADYGYTNQYQGFPRGGWGMGLQAFFNKDSVEVKNYALSGRSSKSFYSDSRGWPVVLPQLKEGDVLLIQFGHNDSKPDERYTDPYTTYKDYLSIYIDSARSKGASPVLLTSVHRNRWSGDQITNSLGDYPDAMRQLASEKNVPLIDLHNKTEKRWEELGEEFVTWNIYSNIPAGLYAHFPDGYTDNTHFLLKGAWEICKMVREGILEQPDIPIFLKLEPSINRAGIIWTLPEPGMAGTFSTFGTCIFPEGTQIEIVPTPGTGKAFSEWKINGSAVSTDPTFNYTVSDSIFELTGFFDTGYKVNININPNNGGTAEGAGSYLEGKEVELTAHAKPGFKFVDWTKESVQVGTDTVLNITISGADVSYSANFEQVPTLNASVSDISVGIFPNPANSVLNILSEERISRVYITDILGKIVFYREVNNYESITDINYLKAGTYYVIVETKVSCIQKTIVVN